MSAPYPISVVYGHCDGPFISVPRPAVSTAYVCEAAIGYLVGTNFMRLRMSDGSLVIVRPRGRN